jgi:protein SCO1/2
VIRPRILFAVACLALAGIIGGAVVLTTQAGGTSAATSGKALVGGPFHLVDQNGRQVDQSLLKGKWSAVFFGYTYCPDVCPTNLQTMAAAQDRLGDKGKDLQVVFISIDPARDTPKQLKDYLSSKAFPRGTIGLTGTPAQVDQAAKAYKVYYAKNGDGADYTMDHSTATYLMDPKGEFVRVIPYALSPDQVADQIRAAMRQE